MVTSTKNFIHIFFLLFFYSCSTSQHSEEEKMRQLNAKGEFIYRHSHEHLCKTETLKHRFREKYPWEETYIGNYGKITKDFFRCKGSSLNPPQVEEKRGAAPLHHLDCGGARKHSLPLKEDREFIYPILIDLLNHIQTHTGERVLITCGHRCPEHNTYADPSPLNRSSKHMIGAEVDFYVQGMEHQPHKVVQLIIDYFKQKEPYRGHKEYEDFLRYDKETNVSTPPWYNKEIFIKLFDKTEGRDLDNQHPYPYLCIQVRFDRDLSEKVVYSWDRALHGYKRH